MSKYTPGPWKLKTVPTSSGICHMIGPFPGKQTGPKERHACLYADYPSKGNPADDELEANARLIASAPQLLHALEHIAASLYWNDYGAPALLDSFDESIIDAAIRAAKGEA